MNKWVVFSAILFAGFSSCKKKGCMDPNALNYSRDAKKENGQCIYQPYTRVEVEFVHKVDTASLEFDKRIYTNKAGNLYSVEALKYFVCDFNFTLSDGTVFTLDEAHYVDAEKNSTFAYTSKGTIPVGEYTGIGFRFGLSEEKNVSGYFTTLPEINMEWPETMGGGYHFMQIEGKYDSLNTGVIKSYATHMGDHSTGSMSDHDHLNISLPGSAFTLLEGEMLGDTLIHFIVEMNINSFYETPTTYNFIDFGTAMMMNDAAQSILMENTHDVFTLNNTFGHSEH